MQNLSHQENNVANILNLNLSLCKQLHSIILLIISGKFTAEGLSCYECKAEDKEKCYFTQSKDEDAPEDSSWFGEKVECNATATHCMTARTRKNKK